MSGLRYCGKCGYFDGKCFKKDPCPECEAEVWEIEFDEFPMDMLDEEIDESPSDSEDDQ